MFLCRVGQADERGVADGFRDVVEDTCHKYSVGFWFECLLTTAKVVVWFKIKVEAFTSALLFGYHPRKSVRVKRDFLTTPAQRLSTPPLRNRCPTIQFP